MTTLYLVHTETKRRFKVLRIDREKGIITLEGEYAAFDEKYDPQTFKSLGYTLEREDAEAAS